MPVALAEGDNRIVACADAAGQTVCSDTLTFTLGYTLHPEVFLEPVVDGGAVVLTARLLDNPNGGPVSFDWMTDARNPGQSNLDVASDSTAVASIPATSPNGEYYFDLVATDTSGAVGTARTFVTKSDSGLTAFDIWSDHAAWVDSAVVYEVTPYNMSANGNLSHVIARLPEWKTFGINTVWIQPVFETGFGGQGYDVTNYFRMRDDYGTEDDLRTLVETAHDMGMRVLLDFVPNHTSIRHPYAQDAMDHGPRSHYYDFYQRILDDVDYSRHYHQRTDGEMTFTYYFWDDLLNINYNNLEVQRWMIEAGLRWIEDFDIDGYRIDAVWGTNARTPEAMQRWRFALKRAKPEVLLLGEDKATRPASFDRRFDVAYDWYPEESWVSHWTWQYDFSENENLTLFKANQGSRVRLLRDAITNRGDGFHPDAKVFRFMENNDTFRFHATHEPDALERTELAATIMFTLHGIPMIYVGQEIGYHRHPYETFQVFNPNRTIEEQDDFGLYPVYERLIAMRKDFRALWSDNFQEIHVDPRAVQGAVYAYHRWDEVDNSNIFVAANLSGSRVTAALTIPPGVKLDGDGTYYMTDLLTGEVWSGSTPLVRFVTTIPANTARVLALGDAPISVGTSDDDVLAADLPDEPALGRNYPNPFADATIIPISLPRSERVRITVHDVLGRQVRDVVDEIIPAGLREVFFDATGIPSGTYFVRAEIGGRLFTQPMAIVK